MTATPPDEKRTDRPVSPLWFALRFLVAFALLIGIGGGLLRLPQHWASALEGAAGVIMPVTTGWWLEHRESHGKEQIWLRRDDRALRLQLALDKLALGVFPFLSLALATSGLGARRLLGVSAGGVSGLFVLDLLIVLAYPMLVLDAGPIEEIIGYVLGLLTFVGGPVILWFVLTFDRLRPLWRLG